VIGYRNDQRAADQTTKERRERAAQFVADVAERLSVDPPSNVRRILAAKRHQSAEVDASQEPAAVSGEPGDATK
jgi:hypothetical protein